MVLIAWPWRPRNGDDMAIADVESVRRKNVFALTTRFKLPQGTDWGRLRAIIAERALVYAGVPGLRSKAFLLDERTGDYGANYLWESRESLDAFRGAMTLPSRPGILMHLACSR